MTKKKHIIYGVSKGEYSDYHVCAIFDTKEKAQRYYDKKSAEAVKYDDDCQIEEFELNPEE